MTVSKAKLADEIRELGAVPPADATANELEVLLRRIKALRSGANPQMPERRRTAPFSGQSGDPVVTPAPSPAAALASARMPGVSDHKRRPYDPHAGW
jgi:hypothetical protein